MVKFDASKSINGCEIMKNLVWNAAYETLGNVVLPSRASAVRFGSAVARLANLAAFKMCLMVASCVLCGLVPYAPLRNYVYRTAILFVFRILGRSFSAVVTFHDQHNRPKTDGICVANHTSPIDVIILSCDQPYAMVILVNMRMRGKLFGNCWLSCRFYRSRWCRRSPGDGLSRQMCGGGWGVVLCIRRAVNVLLAATRPY